MAEIIGLRATLNRHLAIECTQVKHLALERVFTGPVVIRAPALRNPMIGCVVFRATSTAYTIAICVLVCIDHRAVMTIWIA